MLQEQNSRLPEHLCHQTGEGLVQRKICSIDHEWSYNIILTCVLFKKMFFLYTDCK